MVKVTIIAVGKLKEKYLRDACAEYQKRLSSFCNLSITEVDETRCPERPSAAQIEQTVCSEGDKILSRIPKGAYTVAMCIEGERLTSPGLAERISEVALSGNSHIVFIIGGSWGLSDKVKSASSQRLSMSDMTFPHMLARVMLLEQIYRSFQISGGGSYHK